jgi:hypothetical protein
MKAGGRTLATRRRLLMWGGAVAALPLSRPAAAVPSSDLLFRVIRKGSPIGWLQTTFAQGPEGLTVRTKLDVEIYVAFVRVYRYHHLGEEVWQDEKLISLKSETDNDGEQYRVQTTPVAGGLRVEGPRGAVTTPAGTMTTNSSWNPALVQQQMVIDCERGRYVPLAARPLGEKALSVVGQQRTASLFRIRLPYAVGEIWYAGVEWVHGVFTTKGETLTYQRER